MKALVTGSSKGIGRAIALKFLSEGYSVIGIDKLPSEIFDDSYTHYVADVCGQLPEIGDVDIIINNAGVQEGNAIDVNLIGAMRVTEKYINDSLKSIVFIASASATSGAEFPEYAASKGGVVAYMKNVAMRLAPKGVIVNSISPGGVTTELNSHVMEDKALWDRIMDETPLKKWATAEEIADWVYFVAAVNKSMTAQDIIIDNGEISRFNFVW